MSSPRLGGPAAVRGFNFQHGVTAWAAVRLLAEAAAPPAWKLASSTTLDWLRCETEQPVDDLLLGTNHGLIFCNIKRSLTLSPNPNSEFWSVIRQFVQQFLSWRGREPGTHSWDRSLERVRDRLVLVCGPTTSAPIRTSLASVLERIRLLLANQSLRDAATNNAEQRALNVVTTAINDSWQALIGDAPTDADLRELLALVHVHELALDPGQVSERESKALLRSSVLAQPDEADVAWDLLVSFAARLAQGRSGADRPQLQRVLLDAGLDLRSVRSYERDIQELRNYSARTVHLANQMSRILLGGNEVKVIRASTNELVRVAEDGSVVVVGEPGAGKSGALHDLASGLIAESRDVVFLAVDHLEAASLGTLRQELRLEHDVLDVMANWPGQRPAFLIIDALDAARGEPATQTTRTLISRAQDLPRWHVIASIRKFDLRYSEQTRRLFAGSPPSTYVDSDFHNVRHLNILVLDSAELQQIESDAPRLYQLVQSVPSKINSVLFNVRLLADLLDAGADPGQLTAIQNQLELLEKYWEFRVTKEDGHEDDREQVLRLACERMVQNRALHINRAAVSTQANGWFLHTLLSEQVLAEWQPRPDSRPERYVLTFSHHVLFDYAASRLLFRGTPQAVSSWIGNDPDIVLVVRPSLVMQFHHAWSLDPHERQRFWELVFAIARVASIPDVGKLIGPSVAADLARELADLEPLIRIIEGDGEEVRHGAAYVLQHLVGALVVGHRNRRALVGADGGPWCTLAERISRTLNPDTVYSLKVLLITLCERPEILTPDQLDSTGKAARRVLGFGWSAPRRDSWLILYGLQCVCRTFSSDLTASQELLTRALALEHVRDFGYEELPWLAREADRLLEVSPEFVEQLYEAAFSYDESSTESTEMGSGRILSLTSNRRQDYGMALYELARLFPRVLGRHPSRATQSLLKIVEHYVIRRHQVDRSTVRPFDFGGRVARIQEDHSCIWDSSGAYSSDEPMQMLDAFEGRLRELSADNEAENRRAVADVVIASNELAVVWRRLLRVGGEFPETWGRQLLLPLASALPVLTCIDTTHVAGEFLRNVFPLLNDAERSKIERTLLGIPGGQGQHPNAIRDRLLACLGLHDLTTEEAQRLRTALEESGEAPRNEEPVTFGFSSQPYGEEEYLEEQGVPINTEPNRLIRELERPVQSFVAAHRNSAPTLEESGQILPALRTLREAIQRVEETGVHHAQRDHALSSLIQACGSIVTTDNLPPDSALAQFCRMSLMDARDNPDPPHRPESDAQFDEFTSWGSPAIRIEAADGLIRLARHPGCAGQDVLAALSSLCEDPVPAVRFQIARYLNAVYETAPAWMWAQAERVSIQESSTGVLSGFLSGTLNSLANKHPDDAARLAIRIVNRVQNGPGSDNLRQSCVTLLVTLYIWRNVALCEPTVSELSENPGLHQGVLMNVLHHVRGALTYGPVSPTNPDSDAVRHRALTFVLNVTRTACTQFEQLQQAHVTDQPWPAGELESARSLARVIDGIGSQMYFASGAFRDSNAAGERPTREQEIRFFDDSFEVLNFLAEVGIPSLAHHLIETLEHFIDEEPRGVFLLIGRTILSGRRGGYQYESLAVDLMVRVIERYLAEFRYLFRDGAECRSLLLSILDIFVNAGWPSARQLTYGLEEIFR